MLGLWGMGGSGKTTLAAKLFNSLLPMFGDAPCFLEHVRAEASHAIGIVKLQQELLKALTGTYAVVKNMDTGALPNGVHAFAHAPTARFGGLSMPVRLSIEQ